MNNFLQRQNNNLSIFDAFDDFFFHPVFSDDTNEMKTNIRETDKAYELDVQVPGFKKDQIKISLENGYLSVVCEKKEDKSNGTFLRREISSTSARSYFVGDDIKKEDIKAKYENGMLFLSVPKSTPKKIETSYIDID